jgi:GTP-binding protein
LISEKTQFVGVAAELSQCPPPFGPEVVLSGRSNVGKSSLVNALADNRTLARTSNTPGKTRLIIYFSINDRILLTDLPGYGYARVSHQAKAAFSSLADSYLTSSRPVALVLHLLDIRHDPSPDDLQMLDFLKGKRIPRQIVLTKADKLSKNQATQRREQIAQKLDIKSPEDLLILSAQTKSGLDLLRQRIAAVVQDTPLGSPD